METSLLVEWKISSTADWISRRDREKCLDVAVIGFNKSRADKCNSVSHLKLTFMNYICSGMLPGKTL